MGRRLGTVALMRVRARVHFFFLDLISFSSSALEPVAPFFWFSSDLSSFSEQREMVVPD
jgi:hypothetical protein